MTLGEGYTPGGRWERILEVVERRPLRRNAITRAIHDGRHSMNREKAKVHRALDRLREMNLICLTAGGFVATDEGREALHAFDFHMETENG